MDTGLGRDGYSIIGQGHISEILSVRSTDRREIFEEAAGISVPLPQGKKQNGNLPGPRRTLSDQRQDIGLELNVEPLREQAEKAKQYLRLRDELRDSRSPSGWKAWESQKIGRTIRDMI